MIVGKSNGFLTAMLVVLIGLLTFTSCQKEDLDQVVADAQTAMTENNNNFLNYKDQSGETDGKLGHKPGRDGGDCFEVVFPIDISLPDGSVQTANSEEELRDILQTWKDENEITEDTAFPELVFPINIVLEDGTEQAVSSEEQLFDVFFLCFGEENGGHHGGSCNDDDDDEDEEDDEDDDEGEDDEDEEDDEEGEFTELCFDFNYPVTIIFPDGSTATVNSDEEGEMALDNYYDVNIDEEEDPTLDYPVDVTMEDGSIQTLNSDEDLETLEDACEDEAG